MNWSEILIIVMSAVCTFLFGEKLYTYIFLKEDKEAKQADNEARAVETLERAMGLLMGRLEKSDSDSAEKQKIIIAQQKDLYNEREEKSKLREELAVAKCRECQRHGCKDREPQTGY